MTLLVDRKIEGRKTHAFVIGVGAYPDAKANRGVEENLRGVQDLPSAADSAKLVCDWLIANQDKLAAPLATLEVLISDPTSTRNRYPWARGPVDAATAANVSVKGFEWFSRCTSEPNDVAFFYGCGHGVSLRDDPVLFLEDLNSDARNPWTHIHIESLAQAFRKSGTTSAAFLFHDACGEVVAQMQLMDPQRCLFYPPPTIFGASRNQVLLLCAAARGVSAYEGPETPAGQIMFGRFTQTILKALTGSSARWLRDRWAVCGRDLAGDVKNLKQVYFNHWGDQLSFDPYPMFTQTDRLPLVYPDLFEFPFVVMTDPPERMPHYGLVICEDKNAAQPWLKNRGSGEANAWSTTVTPSNDVLFAVAINGADRHSLAFLPNAPLFEQWVPVS